MRLSVITGATINEEHLIEFFLDLYEKADNEKNDKKRRKINQLNHVSAIESNVDNALTFEIPLTELVYDLTHQTLSTIFKTKDQNLSAIWHYTNLGDSVFASMSIRSNVTNKSVIEHECTLPSTFFQEDAMKVIESNKQLFVAIAYSIQQGLIDVSGVRFMANEKDNIAMKLSIDMQYSMKPQHKSKATALISNLSRLIHIKEQPLQSVDQTVKASQTKSQTPWHKQPLQAIPVQPSEIPSKLPSQALTQVQVPPQNQSSVATRVQPENHPTEYKYHLHVEKESVSGKQFLYARSQSFASTLKIPLRENLPAPIPSSESIESFFKMLQPPVYTDVLDQYVSEQIKSRLTPFQSQNVAWMLSREGHYATADGVIKPDSEIYNGLPLLYRGVHHDMDKGDYVNVFNDATETKRATISHLIQKSYRGGLLADEMGLGKTISVLGLVAKHVWDANDAFHPNSFDFPNLFVTKATLIITPGPIVQQWRSEIEKHTPSLKVFVYHGRRQHPDITGEDFDGYDIVLTYYEAFKSEFYYAKPVTKRPRRSGVKYKHSFMRSPLVTTLWFRCILDEAQMVEAPLTSVSSLAKLIPSWYAWAVTGTPLKDRYTDLYGLFDFLNLEDTFNQASFNRFCNDPRNKQIFYQFMKATVRRNMKTALKGQVNIPKQNRHVVRIPFTSIEQHHYDDMWRSCRQTLRLDWMDSINWTLPPNADEATLNDYTSAIQKMRSWLIALRQTCIHPTIISNAFLKLSNSAASNNVQSLDEVLKNMANEAKMTLNSRKHAFYSTQLKIGGMYEVLEDWEHARQTYEANVVLVEDLTNTMNTFVQRRKAKSEHSEKADSYEKQLSLILSRWHLLLHQYYFYMAGIYHRLELRDLEDEFYTKAADIRRILMENHTTRVKTHTMEMHKFSDKLLHSNYNCQMGAREFDSSFLDLFTYEDENDGSKDEGISSGRAADVNTIENVKHTGKILDTQYEKILYLREKIISMLTKSLVDNGDNETEEVTGDEYENSLIEQELCQIYLSAYQALLNDRRFIVNGTFVAASDTKAVDNGEFVSEEGKKIEAAEKVFRQNLMHPRGFKIEHIKDVEFSVQSMRRRIKLEKKLKTAYVLLGDEFAHLRFKVPSQSKLLDDLDTDFKKMNELFNSRVAYYKHLQQISDTLLDWKHKDPLGAIRKLEKDSLRQEELVTQSKSRDQYLTALVEEHKALNNGEDPKPKDCLICQETIEKGIITYCGHTSCVDCGLKWFKTSQRCHTCNSSVRYNEWYTISYKKVEIHDKEAGPSSGVENQQKIQNLIGEINKQKIVEGKGAKLDSIIRHIKHIKHTTNGKCIVFSQWTKALDLLKQGLTLNNIKFTSINASATISKNNVLQFQKSPDINVILLHARSQSSGLTLVAAQTVFIIEPVINESLEKQAINRLHRIGQTKETDVFWYIVQDTIEERIQAIHDMKRSQQGEHEPAITDKKAELSKISDGGGEYVDSEDLRRCFTSNENYALEYNV